MRSVLASRVYASVVLDGRGPNARIPVMPGSTVGIATEDVPVRTARCAIRGTAPAPVLLDSWVCSVTLPVLEEGTVSSAPRSVRAGTTPCARPLTEAAYVQQAG